MDCKNETFTKQTVEVDGNTYTDCKFDLCTFSYSGGELFRAENLETTDCYWTLDGAAKNTVDFLRWMYHNSPRDRKFVEHVIQSIQSPIDK